MSSLRHQTDTTPSALPFIGGVVLPCRVPQNMSLPALDEASAQRLRATLERIAAGESNECPVCLEVPCAKDVRILRCCQQEMCRACIFSCAGLCPFCRGEMVTRSVAEANAPESSPETESPYTYTHLEYGAYGNYTCTNDYSHIGTYTYSEYSHSGEYTYGDYSLAQGAYAATDLYDTYKDSANT